MSKESKADQIIREAAETEAIRFIEGFCLVKERCESPIEEMLLAAIYAQHTLGLVDMHFLGTSEMPQSATFDEAIFIQQQVKVGPYRVDILIHDASCPFEVAEPRFMVVECDGHDFHERTKEQARRDKKRDRFFQSKGFKVLRFTGSEIWADPDACANEVLEQLQSEDSWRNRQG